MNEPNAGNQFDIETILESFEATWCRGEVPSIAQYRGSAVTQGSDCEELLTELICLDLEYRWRKPRLACEHPLPGEHDHSIRRPVLLEHYADLFDDFEITAQLLVDEYQLRLRCGRVPVWSEYERRFPQLAHEASSIIQREVAPKELTRFDNHSLTIKIDNESTLGPEKPAASSHDATSVSPPDDPYSTLGGTSQPAPEYPDTWVGRYRRERLLGKGSFGSVWQAYDETLHRTVAIKTLTLESRDDLLREARGASVVQHPGLVTVYDVIDDGDRILLVMECIEGEPLDVWSAQNQPTPQRAARLISLMAAAAQHAHAAGLYHCDLKPANVIVRADDTPVITDFGLSITRQSQAAMVGQTVGSPAYMSPEQVRGDLNFIDGRTDVWSMGVILYRLLCGCPPFEDESLEGLFDEIEFRPLTPVRQLRPKVPASLAEICERCLQKEPSGRFATAGDFAEALRSATDETAGQAASISVNLPQENETLVGRESDLSQITELLSRDDCQLLTITGPGGIGKTRLSITAAKQYAETSDCNVYWVDLSHAGNEEEIVRAVLAAMESRRKPDSGDTSVADFLSLQGPTLLLIDNFEQVVEFGTATVGRWLSAAPGVKVLVTSQLRLGLRGEKCYSLSPLAIPELSDVESVASGEIDALVCSYSSVKLFVDRAREASESFQVTSENLESIVRICHQIDGSPLAIELAAARTPLLGCEELAEKLAASFKLLKTTRRDQPERQRTIEATIDWSYRLLSPLQQESLRRIASLPAAIPMTVAERLLDSLHQDDILAIETVGELCDRSLLRLAPVSDGRTRMLNTFNVVRRYVAAHQSDVEGDRDSLPEIADALVSECPESSELGVVASEAWSANLWWASERLRAGEDLARATDLALRGDRFSSIRMDAEVRAQRLSDLIVGATEQQRPLLRTRLAEAYQMLGKTEDATRSAREALTESSPTGSETRMESHFVLGRIVYENGDSDGGVEHLTQALQLAEQCGQHLMAARIRTHLGRIARRNGNLDWARELFESALEPSAGLENPTVRASALRERGTLLLEQGKWNDAIADLDIAVDLLSQTGNRRASQKTFLTRAVVLGELGRYDEAIDDYNRAENLSRKLGDRRGLAKALNNRALVMNDHGESETALALLQRALPIYQEIANPTGIAICLSAQAAALLNLQRFDEALAMIDRPEITGAVSTHSFQNAIVSGDRGSILRRLVRLDEAASSLRESLNILRSLGAKATFDALIYLIELAACEKQLGVADWKASHDEAATLAQQLEKTTTCRTRVTESLELLRSL